MGRKSRLFGWVGLGLLGVLFLLGPGRLQELPVRVSPQVPQALSVAIPSGPLATVEGPAVSPECPAPAPDATLSQSPPPVAAPPDRAERKPVRGVRSESYQRLEELIKKYAALHGVDENLVWAVIRHESGFDPGAVSPKGAMGLMQLMPGTAAMLGVKDAFDVEQNIQGGIKYLEMCLARFDQDVGLALAAYNAGPGNVDKYQGCPPFPETIKYVEGVLRDYGEGGLRCGLRLRSSKALVVVEVSTHVVPPGLLWRVPIPHWKVPAPQVKVSQPIWRVPHNFVISAAK